MGDEYDEAENAYYGRGDDYDDYDDDDFDDETVVEVELTWSHPYGDDRPMFTQEQANELKEMSRKYFDEGRMSADGDPEGYGDPNDSWRAAHPLTQSDWAKESPFTRSCPKCKAPVGAKCVYTSPNNIHIGSGGRYVWNETGKPMILTHPERGRRVLQPREEDMSTMSRAGAEAMAAQAAEVLAHYKELEDKYGKEPAEGAVIKFDKQWTAGNTYNYAAIRVGHLWFTTGPRSPKAYKWDSLLTWLDSGDYPTSEIKMATDWTPLAVKK